MQNSLSRLCDHYNVYSFNSQTISKKFDNWIPLVFKTNEKRKWS